MSKSPMEQLRKEGFSFEFGHRITIRPKDGVWVHGCDCAEQLPDEMIPKLIEALTALQRHRHIRESARQG